jgi:hypothetical protein
LPKFPVTLYALDSDTLYVGFGTGYAPYPVTFYLLITSAVPSVVVEKPLPRAPMADIQQKNKENSPLGGGEVTLYAGID